jgi:hypothetical protein
MDYPVRISVKATKLPIAVYEQYFQQGLGPENSGGTKETREADRLCSVLYIHMQYSVSTTSAK